MSRGRAVFMRKKACEGFMQPIKVKIFTYCTHNINAPTELQINVWLASQPDIEIVEILQSESMIALNENALERNLSISVFYRENKVR